MESADSGALPHFSRGGQSRAIRNEEAASTIDTPVAAPRPHLGLWDTVSVIVGIVIGAGLYETAPLVFKNVSGPWVALAAWALGGLLSLLGALCYAELAVTYPRSGGDYVYLKRAFGPWLGFMFGWAQLAIIMTGSIAMMGFVFANYATQIYSLGTASDVIYAITAVVVLTVTNIAGVVFGRTMQNVLTGLKILGISGILLAGFLIPSSSSFTSAVSPGAAAGLGSFGMAMILVLYTYGGWNDAAYVAAEIDDKRRNIPRALILGTLSLTLIYLAVNAAYLYSLGFEGAKASDAIAADVLRKAFGDTAAKVISLLVMISALGAVNGLIYTGSRIYTTTGEDFPLFSRLARWNPRYQSPVTSLSVQAFITLALIFIVGTLAGQKFLNGLLGSIGFGAVEWQGYGGFETLLRCSAPFFWVFFLLTGVSLIVLRYKDKSTPRPFVVPLYPIIPLIFCSTCAYMLYSATTYAGKLVFIGAFPLALGLALYWFGGLSTNVRSDAVGSADNHSETKF